MGIQKKSKPRKVIVQDRIDGSTYVMSHRVALKYQVIPQGPQKAKPVKKTAKQTGAYNSAADHPCRRAAINRPRTVR